VNAVERIGLAPAILLLLLVPSIWALWQVVKWSGKRADRVIVAHVRMTRTFAANDTKHAANGTQHAAALQQIAANDQAGHATTHQKLDAIHADVRRALAYPEPPPSGPPQVTSPERGAGDAR
jgi:hypothetical protein